MCALRSVGSKHQMLAEEVRKEHKLLDSWQVSDPDKGIFMGRNKLKQSG